jgi:hypothetical protein
MAIVKAVDIALESLNVPLLHAMGWGTTRGRRGELGLGDEQFVLETADQLANIGELVRKLRDDEAQQGPELVVRPVGADAGGVLLYARTTGKTGRASVARTGIETRDALASGRHGSWSRGELRPWTGQYEMCSTSLCFASCRHSRQMNPLRSLQAIAIDSMMQPFPVPGG